LPHEDEDLNMAISTIPGNRAERGILVAIGLIAAAVAGPAAAQPAPQIDFGEPGPQWLRDSESYAVGYDPAGWDALAQSKVKFITHCPINREFFARCHALAHSLFSLCDVLPGLCLAEVCQGCEPQGPS
jgi:hypothetical protein